VIAAFAVAHETSRVTATAGTGTTGAEPFIGDFESGGKGQWVVQAANAGYRDKPNVRFGEFHVDDTIVGEGSYSGRFTLPAFQGGRTRSQLFTRRSSNEGGDDYYSLMFYVPPGGFHPGTSGYWGVQIAELNWEGLAAGQPTFSLVAQADHVTARLCSGRVGARHGKPCQYDSNADIDTTNVAPRYAVARGRLEPGWHEFVVHAHWATDSTGAIEVWHRRKGQTAWSKNAVFKGYPTLQSSPGGSVPASTIDIIQAYRGPSSRPVTVWLDGFGRWQSLAAAKAALP
jgi:Polysaccharide lyase